jgi:2'-5' RNA ligase
MEFVLSGLKPFRITLQGITPVQSFGNYLFLEITEGKDEIVEIHKRLYTGLLESVHPQWLKVGGYHPHMTVGKIADEEEYKAATKYVEHINDMFCSVFEKVSVEVIDENEDSLIEIEVLLD